MSILNSQHSRFKDAPWYPKTDINVLVGGAGGIGSWLSLLLSRAGFKPVVYDYDLLEDHNLGGQIFPKRMIGKLKVEALQDVIKDFSGEEIIIFNQKMDEDTMTNLYVFSAFDNMQARKDIFKTWVSIFGNDPRAIFIDGRLEAEQMFIYCITSKNIDQYAKLLSEQDDSNIAEAPCTMKQTSHSAAMIASHMVAFFTNHITNVVEKEDTRTVPFSWEYFIPMDLLQTEN